MTKKLIPNDRRSKINQLKKLGYSVSNDKPGGFIFVTAPAGRIFSEDELDRALEYVRKEVPNA